MEMVKKAGWLSVEDYLAGELASEIKHEYLGGNVHAMSGGTVRHQQVAGNVFLALGGQLKGKPCRPFNSDMKVRLELPNQTRFYYPDVQIVRESSGDEETYQDKPVVVVEVLSDSTRRIDLGEKREAYLAIPTLKLLLMVDPGKVWIQVDRRGASGGFGQELYRSQDEIIEMPEIECRISVSEIYEQVSLSD
jgi:Uma2 family endonuclease